MDLKDDEAESDLVLEVSVGGLAVHQKARMLSASLARDASSSRGSMR